MAWMDEIFRFLLQGRKPDGSLDDCALDAERNLKVVVVAAAPPPPTPVSVWDDPPGLLADRVVKGSSGTLLQFFGFSNTPGFLQVFDEITVPLDGALPVFSVNLWGWGNPFTLPLAPDRGRRFLKGITWAFSTTPEKLTKDPTAQVWANAERL